MKRRDLIAFALLNLFTLGIYSIYWLYVTRRDMVARGASIPAFGWLLWPWLIGFLAIPIMALGANSGPDTGTTVVGDIAIGVMVISFIAASIISLWWLWKYSAGVQFVTGNRLETIASFVMILFVDIIGFMVIQHYFNKVIDAEAVPQAQ